MKKLLYFGRIGVAGHYLFESETGRTIWGHTELLKRTGIAMESPEDVFWKIDGGYTPKSTREQGSCRMLMVPPFLVLAWHDYTSDVRPGSNSALLGLGYGSMEEVLADAAVKFPSVMARQNKPLRIVEL